MKFGFSTYFFNEKKPLQVIEEALSEGIRVFELSQEIPHVLGMDEAFFKEIDVLSAQGVEFSMHAPFFEINLGSFFDDIRSISKTKIMDAVDKAERLGIDPLVVHPGYTFVVHKVEEIERRTKANFVEDLNEVLAHAEERGVRIALENVHMPYFFFYNLNEFEGLRAKIPGIGMALDVGHAFITQKARGTHDPEGAILADLEQIGVEHLVHVHLHNNRGTKDDHTFLRGSINMERIVRGLERIGYAGKIIIESYDMEQYGIAPVVRRVKELKALLG
jgi:sugar phosphate isomerase/epimerase